MCAPNLLMRVRMHWASLPGACTRASTVWNPCAGWDGHGEACYHWADARKFCVRCNV